MRNCFFVLLVIIVVLLIGPFLVFFNLNRTILQPAYLKGGLTQTKLYERISSIDPNELRDFLAKSLNLQDNSQKLNTAAIADLTQVIPPQALKEAFETNLDRTVSEVFYRGNATVILEFGGLKSAILANRPSQDTATLVQKIQDTYTVKVPPRILFYGKLVAHGRLYLGIFAAIFGLLVLILLLLAHSWQTRFRALSLIFLLGGLFALATYSFSFVISWSTTAIQLPPSMAKLLSDLVVYFESSFFRLFLIEGIVFVVLAIVLFALAFLFKPLQVAAVPKTK